jgi:hypothetical protein
VLDRLSRLLIIGLLSVSVLPIAAHAQAPAAAKAPAWKDQGEFDIASAADKEKTDLAKKLDLLHQWEQKYPESDYQGMRAVQIASTESQIADKARTANPSPADIDAAQKAALDLIDNVGKYLAPENKPAGATDDQWAQAKKTITLAAHQDLAATYAAKKDDAKTEAEYRTLLGLDPNSAPTAYSLGILIYRQKNISRFPEAFFWIARGIEISGAEALPAATKAAADKYLKQAYSGYHGDDTGLDDVKKAAAASPTLPPDFKIESAVDIAKREEGNVAKFEAEHPDLALFNKIRDALKGDGGPAYFEQVKGSAIPPDGGAFKMFKGKVVSQPSPKEVLLNVENPVGDVTLQFETALKGTIDPGTDVSFKGVVEAFVKEPYMLTLTADKEDVEGIPASAFAGAPAAKPKPRRPATKK